MAAIRFEGMKLHTITAFHALTKMCFFFFFFFCNRTGDLVLVDVVGRLDNGQVRWQGIFLPPRCLGLLFQLCLAQVAQVLTSSPLRRDWKAECPVLQCPAAWCSTKAAAALPCPHLPAGVP